MSGKRICVITLITASIFAVAIAFPKFSNAHGFSQLKHQNSEHITADHEGTGGFIPLKPVAIHSLSLPATFNLRTHVLTWFLFRIFVFACTPEACHEEPCISINRFFERIFTFSISPNAP